MSRLRSISIASCVALLPTTTVLAADVGPVGGTDWSGPYAGLHGGYSWGSSKATYDDDLLSSLVNSIEMKPEGLYGGVQIGYNHQTTSNWVFGLEADLALASISDEVTDELGNLADGSTGDYIKGETDWAGTIRGRLGYALSDILIYATGGLAFADSKVTSVDCDYGNVDCDTRSDEQMLTGFALGAGAELMLTETISVKAEYLFTDYSATEYFSDELWASESDSSSQNIRVGVNYHF